MSYEREAMQVPIALREQCDVPDMSQLSISSNFGSSDIFEQPISTNDPLGCFQRISHPVPLPSNLEKSLGPVGTNKFYGNMFLESQSCPVWTHPYSLWWSKDGSQLGMAVSYIEDKQKVFGPGDPPQYYFSPTNIKSFVFSSSTFSNSDDMELGFTNPKHMSIEASVLLKNDKSKKIRFPMVQGMGFVTAIYEGLSPKIQSAIGFRSFENKGKISSNITKFTILLENDLTWSLFVYTPDSEDNVELVQKDGQTLETGNDFSAQTTVIQIIPSNSDEIDALAGSYFTDCKLGGSNDGSYSFTYAVNGVKTDAALLFAMPHHVQTLNNDLQNRKTNISLDSTVYGKLNGYKTNFLQFHVELPTSYGLDPSGKSTSLSSEYTNVIGAAATYEIQNCNIQAESSLDSMYFSGKALAKYAWMMYTTHYMLKDGDLTGKLMGNLKEAFQKFVDNQQILPLNYDTTWNGLVSSGSESQDFGNAYYNDHHFHYGYHVLTGAIIAKIDKELTGNDEWLQANREWINSLVRDYANPSESDPYFPVFRAFDWFGGHSWAKGLFPSGDGKDQESSSEDANASYALKLWGNVSGNTNLESIGNLQLGIMKNSFNNYFLYSNENEVQPSNFAKNKVAGIFFENKIDHATYFGNNIEYIQMIHAIPIIPISTFIRSPTFVREEYEERLQSVVDTINDGWKGIIMLNVALFDAQTSYNFFSDPNFGRQFLDGGQSLTWSLAFSASLI